MKSQPADQIIRYSTLLTLQYRRLSYEAHGPDYNCTCYSMLGLTNSVQHNNSDRRPCKINKLFKSQCSRSRRQRKVSRLRKVFQILRIWQIHDRNQNRCEYFCCAGPLSTETITFPRSRKQSHKYHSTVVLSTGER